MEANAMETSIINRWITDPASVTDPEGADVLRSLQGARPDYVMLTPEELQRLESEMEVSCVTARRIVRPLPRPTQDEGGHDTAEIGGAAAEHLEQCSDCKHWVFCGKPYPLDLQTSDSDRTWFCERVRSVVQTPAGPQSEAAAREHAERCRSCTTWLKTWDALASCETVRVRLRWHSRVRPRWSESDRARLESWRQSEDLARATGADQANWNHDAVVYENHPNAYHCFPESEEAVHPLLYEQLEECRDCREWCVEAVPCEQVRDFIQFGISMNGMEWKAYRHDTLNPLEACHLHMCPDCQQHLRDNYEQTLASAPIFAILDELSFTKRSHEAANSFYSTLASAWLEALEEMRSAFREASEESCSAPQAPVEPPVPDPRGKDTPIDAAGFKSRTYHILKDEGVETIGQLAEKDPKELQSCRRIRERNA